MAGVLLVPEVGLEPTRNYPSDFESRSLPVPPLRRTDNVHCSTGGTAIQLFRGPTRLVSVTVSSKEVLTVALRLLGFHQVVEHVLEHFHFDVTHRRIPVLVEHRPDEFGFDVGAARHEFGQSLLAVLLDGVPVLAEQSRLLPLPSDRYRAAADGPIFSSAPA